MPPLDSFGDTSPGSTPASEALTPPAPVEAPGRASVVAGFTASKAPAAGAGPVRAFKAFGPPKHEEAPPARSSVVREADADQDDVATAYVEPRATPAAEPSEDDVATAYIEPKMAAPAGDDDDTSTRIAGRRRPRDSGSIAGKAKRDVSQSDLDDLLRSYSFDDLDSGSGDDG